ncbi:hypothetical protein DFH09DRAFT_1322410 [Mycena vulgaris]|nr:hypothetical protein DFH09DRAFT_1322410 [Mycena vulgaris]
MPKVKAPTVSKSTQSSFFVLTDGKKRVLVLGPGLIWLAARRHFPLIEGPLTLETAELDVCGGELTDISPDIWEMAVELLSSVLVKGEPSVPAKAQPASASAFPPALGDHQARVAINVYLSDASIDVRAKSTTSFRTILSSVLESLGIAGCPDHYRVLLDGHSCYSRASPQTLQPSTAEARRTPSAGRPSWASSALDPTLFRVLEWGGMEVLGR